MGSFFERNKKKGLLAALLLLLRRGKGPAALLVLIAMLAAIFVVPSRMKIPWADKDRDLPPVAGERFSSMVRSAKESVLVQASLDQERRRLAAAGRLDSLTSAYLDLAKLPPYRLPKASSVAGIMDPDRKGGREKSVQLAKEELLNGLIRSAEAGTIVAGGAMAEAGAMAGNSAMADAGSMAEAGPMAEVGSLAEAGKMAALSKGSAINPGSGVVERALDAAKVPAVPGGGAHVPKGEKFGALTGERAKQLAFKGGGARNEILELADRESISGNTFFNLAWARAYSVTAAPPTCQEGAGCTKEYAHNTAGIAFDGQHYGGAAMNSTAIDESANPSLPDKDKIKDIEDATMKYYNDTRACEASDRWANNERPDKMANGLPPDKQALKDYDQLLASVGPVGTYAQRFGTASSFAGTVDPVIATGQATERSLMSEMQHLSCAMACREEKDECNGWKNSPGVKGVEGAAACEDGDGPCDQGTCAKSKALKCKKIGNYMRSVCLALRAIWREKCNSCPLSSGHGGNCTTFDYHECQ